MKLSLQALTDPRYRELSYALPAFDIPAMRARTLEHPTWLHFGAGNIFRAFPAAGLQCLLDSGAYDRGVVVAESFDGEIIEKAYHPYDEMSLLVVLKADGTTEKRVVASVAASFQADPAISSDWQHLTEIAAAASLQMITFTVTEKGYSTQDKAFLADQAEGPGGPGGLIGRLTALLLVRFQKGGAPLALVSMDNCSHNGDKLRDAVVAMATAWTGKGYVPADFLEYLKDTARVSFPWTMIDKITPRPDERVRESLGADGFAGTELIQTAKGTFTAPFVNAEEAEYLVVEDDFPGGRPPLEKCGVLFTDRETVDKAEKMKVCACLNPLHTALAVFGCLLGHTLISEEMKDADLKTLVERLAREEHLPVVVNPGILSPEKFLDQVLTVRFPNPFLPDAPQRIATDTSQKLSIRFGETIKAHQQRGSADSLRLIPLVLAGWVRYLMGMDDEGQPFVPSADPLMEQLRPLVAGLALGGTADRKALEPLLKNSAIFGVDLVEAGIADRVTGYLDGMLAGPGAVRRTLREALA